MTDDRAALDQWYTIGALQDFPQGERRVRLLSTDLVVRRGGETFEVDAGERPATHRTDNGHLWVTLGTPARDPFALPEWDENDRRAVHDLIV